MADLIGRLVAEYPTFDFFQAVSLLEEYFRKQGTVTDPIASGRIRFVSDIAITFPPNDIAGVNADASFVQLVLSFMGLTGVSSPLPQYFAEYVHKNNVVSPALQDFLAIFNNRMYALFYRAWKKYHFMRTFSPAGSDAFSSRVAALAGVDIGTSPEPAAVRMLAYTGVLASRSRGPAGLRAMVSDFFGAASGSRVPVSIRQWLPRWTEIPDPPAMGVDCRLGVNAIAGTRLWDVGGKFRIVIGPLSREVYETFLPGTDNIARLKQITQSYLSDPLEFDIEVQLQSIDLVPVVLGEDTARLGATSSLGRSDRKSSVQSTVIG